MQKIYGLRNDKENISLIVGDGKTLLIIQTAESYEVKELYLEFDNKDESKRKEQPVPLQKALKRIKELERVTDVRIDEEFKSAIDAWSENRLTITIDYLDVDDIVKEMKKAGKCKLY